jgi:hypothetical protein
MRLRVDFTKVATRVATGYVGRVGLIVGFVVSRIGLADVTRERALHALFVTLRLVEYVVGAIEGAGEPGGRDRVRLLLKLEIVVGAIVGGQVGILVVGGAQHRRSAGPTPHTA